MKTVHGAAMQDIEGGANLVDKETLSVIKDATKSLASRVKSNFGGSISFSKMQNQHQDKSDDSSDVSPTSPVVDPTGIKKAYEDAEVLKSIVVPLEEQIVVLKEKLRETDALLREHEQRQAESIFSAEILGRWLTGKKSFNEALEELEKRSQECMSSESEDSSTSGRTFTALLNARLSLVVKELSELKSQNNQNVSELERSLKKCADLRSQTAEANGRLLRCQQKHASELAKVAALLSEEQKLSLTNSLASNHQDTNSEKDSIGKTNSNECLTEEIVIRRSEWSSTMAEMDKMRALLGLGLDVDVVGSDQFKQLQAQLGELRVKYDKQIKREEKLKTELQIMEEQWNQRAESHLIQVIAADFFCECEII